MGWDPELNKRSWAPVTDCLSLCFLIHTQSGQLPHTWDHKPPPPQWITHSNCEPKKRAKTTRKRKQTTKKPSFPKMLWFFATVTRKQVLYFITYCFDPICGPTVIVKLLSAITNWPTCQIQKLVLPTRLIVLFTPSKVCNPAPLHAGFLPSSILTYFSVFRIFRVLLCLLYF